jgi:hypothetical protein
MKALRFVCDAAAAPSTSLNRPSGMTTITFGMAHLRLESIHSSIHLSIPLS